MGLIFQSRVDVVAEGCAQLRGRRDRAREPDSGNYADEYLHDLICRCAGTHRGVGVRSEGRPGASDRDQRGESGERQGFRVES